MGEKPHNPGALYQNDTGWTKLKNIFLKVVYFKADFMYIIPTINKKF